MGKALKKRILPLLLALLVSAGLVYAAPKTEAAGVTFFAVDEKLLDLGYGATYYGGELYVTPGVFSFVSGVYTSYSSSLRMVTMYNSSSSLVFDLTKGTAYTVGGDQHDVFAITIGSSAYVPLEFVCSYFGVTYSYIPTDIAPMIRIKTGDEALRDSTFVNAATPLMQSRYNEYVSAHPELFIPPVTVCLCLKGSFDENTGALVDSLASMGVKAAFFTDAESIENYPETAFKIVAQGHSLGVFAETSGDEAAFNDALDELMMTRSRLAMGDEALRDAGYAVIVPNVDATGIGERTTVSRVVSAIGKYAGGYALVQMDMGDSTAVYISQIASGIVSGKSWQAVDETFA